MSACPISKWRGYFATNAPVFSTAVGPEGPDAGRRREYSHRGFAGTFRRLLPGIARQRFGAYSRDVVTRGMERLSFQ
jgi:hypothetical protein